MDAKFQTSFIPKKSMPAPTVSRNQSVSVFLLVSVGVFVIALGFSTWAFFYQRSLVSEITELDSALSAAKKTFELGFIDEVTVLSNKIEAAKDLLVRHVALTPFFYLLEDETLAKIRFTDLNLSIDENSGAVTATMTGQAKSFNSIALQSDVFGKETKFKNPTFSDFQLDKDGNVMFKFTTNVDPSILLYKKTVSATTVQNTAVNSPSATTSTTTATTTKPVK
ncbi:MAG: hypothetical protein WCT19_01830 [Candidatus Paceibacterota bacterium]|jgi:hypothetical protein